MSDFAGINRHYFLLFRQLFPVLFNKQFVFKHTALKQIRKILIFRTRISDEIYASRVYDGNRHLNGSSDLNVLITI
jgi:capsular polysaccharide biosynthesis protein